MQDRVAFEGMTAHARRRLRAAQIATDAEDETVNVED